MIVNRCSQKIQSLPFINVQHNSISIEGQVMFAQFVKPQDVAHSTTSTAANPNSESVSLGDRLIRQNSAYLLGSARTQGHRRCGCVHVSVILMRDTTYTRAVRGCSVLGSNFLVKVTDHDTSQQFYGIGQSLLIYVEMSIMQRIAGGFAATGPDPNQHSWNML